MLTAQDTQVGDTDQDTGGQLLTKGIGSHHKNGCPHHARQEMFCSKESKNPNVHAG